MDYPSPITNHEKGKHLSYEDHVTIELRRKDGWSANAIARVRNRLTFTRNQRCFSKETRAFRG